MKHEGELDVWRFLACLAVPALLVLGILVLTVIII